MYSPSKRKSKHSMSMNMFYTHFTTPLEFLGTRTDTYAHLHPQIGTGAADRDVGSVCVIGTIGFCGWVYRRL